MNTVMVTKTITEHSNGKIADLSYSTGYKRRAGTKRIDPTKPAKHGNTITLYEEVPAPRTFVVGSQEYYDNNIKGGVIKYEFEGIEPGSFTLTADDVEVLLRHHVRNFTEAMDRLSGVTYSGRPEMTPLELVEMRDQAIAGALRLGCNLLDTNVAAR